jgi:FixJ family two-component response regulator
MTDRPPGLVVAVVDDDPSVLDSLGMLLQSADHAVRLFDSGKALLESGCLAEIDCLISDIDMPGMDGFELLRAVRAARPGLSIILITCHLDMVDRSPPADRGYFRWFKKPFDAEELLGAVRDAVRNPRPPVPRP